MCNECSICFEESPKCKLVCGHSFHHECIKTWYMTGNNTGCPMCRHDICYRGMVGHRTMWEIERREQQFSNIYRKVIMETISLSNRMGLFKHKDYVLKATLEGIETDYIKLKEFIEDPEDMEFFLCNPLDMPMWHKGPPIYHEDTFKPKPPKKFKNPSRLKKNSYRF